MNNPFLINRKSKITYFGIWILLCIIQMLLFHFAGGRDMLPVITDVLISNGLYSACILGLWYPVSAYKNILNIPLFLLFHLLLLMLCFILTSGGTIWVFTSLYSDESYKDFLIETLPYRAWTDTFVYLASVLSYYLMEAVHRLRKQSEEIGNMKEDTPEETLSRIAVKKNKEIRFISVQDILYIEANGDYVLIYTPAGRFLKDKTMKYLETHLPVEQFVRIHRSFIINIEYMTKLELYEKDMYQAELKGGVLLKVSSGGYKLLKQRLK